MVKFFQTIKQAASEFIADGCMSSGAAIAYYAIFALPPLTVMVFMLVGYAGVSQQRINEAIKERLGIPASAAELGESRSQDGQNAANGAARDDTGSPLGAVAQRAQSEHVSDVGTIGGIVGVLILVFTATGLFGQLQYSLNRAWGVEPDPNQGGIKRFFLKRLLSLGMILIIAFLLLFSTVFSMLIDEIMAYIQGAAPNAAVQTLGMTLDNLTTLVLATALFAAMFKFLPDVDIKWRDTWVGAVATALLFVAGKALIAWYLQRSNLGSSWGGAAASMIAVLAWFYYTSLIVLYGAEFTQVWAGKQGQALNPEAGARRTSKANQDRQ